MIGTSDRERTSAPVTAMRRAQADDIKAVAEIERVSFSDPWSTSEFNSVLHSGHTIFLVMQGESKRVIGYVVALCVLDQAEILSIAVDPENRRGGLGGNLLDVSIAEAVKSGARSVFLEVRESNTAARALYASRGFEEISRRRSYYRRPVEDALVLMRATQ